MSETQLRLNCPEIPVDAQNAGLFHSRGVGTHPTRTIDSHELIVVTASTLYLREDDREFAVGPGQALLLFPGRVHGGTRAYDPHLRFFWLHFMVKQPQRRRRSAGAAEAFPGFPAIRQYVELADPDRMVTLLRRFLDDQESGHADKLVANLLLLQMLVEMTRVSPAADSGSVLVQEAERIIRTRYHEGISTVDIATAMRCNPDYLGRIYRQAYGKTIGDALIERRVYRACQLLMETSLQIAEVARACGFADPGYFRRIFQRQTGLGPKSYRKQYSRVHIIAE